MENENMVIAAGAYIIYGNDSGDDDNKQTEDTYHFCLDGFSGEIDNWDSGRAATS